MLHIPARALRPLTCASLAIATACAGTDPLSVDQSVRATEDEPSLALLAASSSVGGTKPSLAALPNSVDTLAVGDSVQYVPTGSMIRREVRQYWYTTTPEIASVSPSGWVRAVALGTTTVIMVPQASPYPTAFTRLTVVPRDAVPATGPGTTPPPPTVAPSAPATSAASAAELPRDTVSVAMPVQNGRTLFVARGGNLQAALDSARGGDVVTLEPGATFTGTFVLRQKPTAGWIVVRTGVPDASLPAQGTRMTPARAASANLAKVLTSANNSPAFRTDAGAARWRLIGLEIAPAPAMTLGNALVELGFASTADLTSRSQLPQDIILDRLYIHGTPTLDMRRCVALHSGRSAVVDSYLSECHYRGADSQAIIGYNGSGPYRIENNYLEGAGMGIMFGGAAPGIADMVPSDIVVRRNYFFKPLSWKGVWEVKNAFELKIGQRVLVEQNVFENVWAGAQSGAAILFKTTAYVDNPAQMTSDVTFRWNQVKCASQGVNISGQPENTWGTPARRITITQNLFHDIGMCNGEGGGRMVQLYNALEDVVVDRNTFVSPNAQGQFVSFEGRLGARLTFTNNIGQLAEYGVFSPNGMGTAALQAFWPNSWTFSGNVLVGTTSAAYPANNPIVGSLDAVGFANAGGGDYRLTTSSPYQGRGVDVAALNTALGGVR